MRFFTEELYCTGIWQDQEIIDKQVKKYVQDIHDHLERRPYYLHVNDVIDISNKDTMDTGVVRLKEAIMTVAKDQSYWGEHQPNRWLALMEKTHSNQR